MTLQEFQQGIKDCQNCPLAAGRSQVVFGDGNPNAGIMFVGEAPGFHEDRQGLPFVGSAGKLLSDLLAGIGLKRSDVYIANIIKCRPPENRDPTPEEIEACRPHLMRQIDLIKPRVICTLGNHATRALVGRNVGITKLRGQHIQVDSYFVLPMFHPAAALHQGNLLDGVREDFRNLKKFLEMDLSPEPQARQMELF